MSDLKTQTFVDLVPVTRKQYYDQRKNAIASAKDCFVLRNTNWDVLYTKDGDNFYCGVMMTRIDGPKFEGINVVKTRDIYRVYIDMPPQLPLAEDEKVGEEVGKTEPEKVA